LYPVAALLWYPLKLLLQEKDERQFSQVRARFSIGLNFKDKESLLKIKNQLNIGNIYSIKKDMCLFEVATLKDIKLYIIPCCLMRLN
jgi:hypothetical protein